MDAYFVVGEELLTYPRFVINRTGDAGAERASIPPSPSCTSPTLPASSSSLTVPATVTPAWVAAGGKSLCLSFSLPPFLHHLAVDCFGKSCQIEHVNINHPSHNGVFVRPTLTFCLSNRSSPLCWFFINSWRFLNILLK